MKTTLIVLSPRDGRYGKGTLEIGYCVETDQDGDPQPLKMDWPGIPDAKRAESLIRENARWAR